MIMALRRLFAALLPALALLPVFAQAVSADDNLFPPAPAAASAVSFDGRGFLIRGKRTFLASGGMEYSRIPHALWRDRLLRLKRAGFNCVEVYTFWNVHEPHPNQFDFSGDADLNAFLNTVQSLGLYAIVRVGPYSCAEWDSGGYPVWLRFVPGLRVREDNPQFMAAVDRFWSHLIPVVAVNQINRGGCVILVQLENEHPLGWGRVLPNSYFVHLQQKALSLGLEVPYFFSGLHHASDPAGDTPWSSTGRQSPWFSTEFWSVWYDRYGQTQSDTDTYDRRLWKVLAYGGNGLNFYMFHGGTNFGYTNDDEDASSYDYGAAIGQAGDLRPTYYRFKRAALFARSFESVLEDSDNATDTYKSAATNPSVRITARKSPSGTILFLDNPSTAPVKTQVKDAGGTLFPSAGTLTLAPGQIAPIVRNFPLLPGVTLERATPLLGIQHSGSTTTLVAYGTPGDVADVQFRLPPHAALKNVFAVGREGDHFTVRTPITGNPSLYEFQVNNQHIRLITLTKDQSDHVWFANDAVIVGPDYVGDIVANSSHLSLTAEGKVQTGNAGLVYGVADKPRSLVYSGPATFLPMMTSLGPALSAWQTLPGNLQAAPNYSDAAWKTGADPLPMGADGDKSAYAWYRTTVNVPKAGSYTLHFSGGGDWASVFSNGRHLGSEMVKKGVAVTLPAGSSTLAVLTAHYGRGKLFNYLGPIDTVDAKGLAGPVLLDTGEAAGPEVTKWRVKADAGESRAAPPTATAGAGWADGTTGPDLFNGRVGFAWYVAALPAIPGPHRRLHFENVDDNAAVYLNGRLVRRHEGWGTAFNADLDTAWNANSPNTLAVLVENTGGGGGIQGSVTLQTVNAGDEIAVTNWKMHGGIAEPGALAGWKPGAPATADAAPAYFRATFRVTPPGETGPHPILRITTTGLSRGFVWLNGHNLGRYPEKIAVDGLYLPEPWLKAGGNEVVIFDEEGFAPSAVKLTVEQAASRFVVPMTEK